MVSLDKQTVAGGKAPVEMPPKVQNAEPKISWQQVMGCLAMVSVNFANGVVMSSSSALVAEFLDKNSDIYVTTSQAAWIASVIPLTSSLGAFFAAYLMEQIGRVATVQSNTLPLCIGWAVVALAPNYMTIMIGRVITGYAIGVASTASAVFVVETAVKQYRGSLSCASSSLASFGMLFGYMTGALVDWRTATWIAFATPLLPFVLVLLFAAESPVWLRSKGRTEAARRACTFYYNDPEFFVLPPATPGTPRSPRSLALASAGRDVEGAASIPASKPANDHFFKQLWLLLKRKSGFKPLLILSSVLVLQQLTGIYITTYYAVTFFQTAGTEMDPYIASVLMGGMRFIASTLCIFLLGACRRRVLMIVSTLGMAVSMAAAAYSTSLALDETMGGPPSPLPSWFFIACVSTYIFASSIGLQTIPWTMAAELFPQRVRGVAQALNGFIGTIVMFSTLQKYPDINYYLGGAVGVQYAFAGFSLVATLFCWIFLPETHRKTLSEIEEYFVHNTIFLGHKK